MAKLGGLIQIKIADYDSARYVLPAASGRIKAGDMVTLDADNDSFWVSASLSITDDVIVGIAYEDANELFPVRVIAQGSTLPDRPLEFKIWAQEILNG